MIAAAPSLDQFYHLRSYDELDSTNEEARRQAQAGAAEGTLIWARAQTAGRGRRGRNFISPPGNLYMSILLRPDQPGGVAAQLGFAAALAVGEAVLTLLPETVSLAYKWPNDVLLDGRKTCGILLESQAAGEGRVDWLVVGIGVNIVSFPAGIDFPATALAACGAGPIPVETALEAVAGRFLHWYELWREAGFAPLRAAWLARAHGLGEVINVRLPGEETIGRFVGLDEDGALLLEQGATLRRITAGDVFPVVG
jgi:BirA family biotin operon repressor/biotin-[acetyl-CoA-carboxylase] ligase